MDPKKLSTHESQRYHFPNFAIGCHFFTAIIAQLDLGLGHSIVRTIELCLL